MDAEGSMFLQRFWELRSESPAVKTAPDRHSQTQDESDDAVFTDSAWFAYHDCVVAPVIGQEDIPSSKAVRVDADFFEGPSQPQPKPMPPNSDAWCPPHDSHAGQRIEVLCHSLDS
jgi:hypothetical protein